MEDIHSNIEIIGTILSLAKKPQLWHKVRQAFPIVGFIIACLGIAVIVALILVVYQFNWPWTGFDAHIGPQLQQYQPAKTLWDWMQLLIVPIVLTVGGILYNRLSAKADSKSASDNQNEVALQKYLDRMSELLLDKQLRNSEPSAEVRCVAHARTATVLPTLDAVRRGSLIRFLSEAGLIDTCLGIDDLKEIDLQGANLSRIDLHNVTLPKANLSGTNLKGTDLSYADLHKANLRGANLSKANLSHAKLGEANLSGANLSGADLSYADLSGAELSGTNLNCANLRRAILNKAHLFAVDLHQTDLSEATLSETNLIATDTGKAKVDQSTLNEAIVSHPKLAATSVKIVSYIDMIK